MWWFQTEGRDSQPVLVLVEQELPLLPSPWVSKDSLSALEIPQVGMAQIPVVVVVVVVVVPVVVVVVVVPVAVPVPVAVLVLAPVVALLEELQLPPWVSKGLPLALEIPH